MVLNVVGSNPTSHPKGILDNHKIIEDFLFIRLSIIAEIDKILKKNGLFSPF